MFWIKANDNNALMRCLTFGRKQKTRMPSLFFKILLLKRKVHRQKDNRESKGGAKRAQVGKKKTHIRS